MKLQLTLITSVLLFSSLVHAASFDCAKASILIEKAICTESNLSALDDLLMQSYKKALTNSPDANALKSNQRDWLKNVRNKCQDSACLKRVYNDRITELNSVTASSATTIGGVTGTYQYAEKGFSGTMKVSEMSECKLAPNKLGCLSSIVLVAKIDTLHYASVHDCDMDLVENKSARITSGSKTEVTFVAKDKSDGDISYEVIFSPKGAYIKSGGGGCAVQGSILGHWKRSKE